MKKRGFLFVMILTLAVLFCAGCGSDEVVYLYGDDSDETTASGDSSEEDGSSGEDETQTLSAEETEEIAGVWDDSAQTYTNPMLGMKLSLSGDWQADTENEGSVVLSRELTGVKASIEIGVDLYGFYASADEAWEAYYEYMDLTDEKLMVLATSAYAAYDTMYLGDTLFDTLTLMYVDENAMAQYRLAAIQEADGYVVVFLIAIEGDIAAFSDENEAYSAVDELTGEILAGLGSDS